MTATRVAIVTLWGFYLSVLVSFFISSVPLDETLTLMDHVSGVVLWLFASLWLVSFTKARWNTTLRGLYREVRRHSIARSHHRGKSMS